MDYCHYEVSVGETIVSKFSHYKVQKILGSGAFGVVSQCHRLFTNETVALKMLHNTTHMYRANKEEVILQKLMDSGAADHNIVQWFQAFDFMGHYCLEFEPLDMTLLSYYQIYGTLQLKELRPLAHQMATALKFLKSQRMVHCDLKHNNIMMANHATQPFRIKLIDFGQARYVSEIKERTLVQASSYRAPEVFLGALFDEAIDVWSIGCILTELYTGHVLFHGNTDYDLLRRLFHIAGMPPADLIERSWNRFCYFHKPGSSEHWEFMEFDNRPIRAKLSDVFNSDAVSVAEECDRVFFLDLIRSMLKVDPGKRITPEQILSHPFVTLDHLSCCRTMDLNYVNESEKVMAVLGLLTVEDQLYSEITNSVPQTTTTEQPNKPPQPKKRLREEDLCSEEYLQWTASELERGDTSPDIGDISNVSDLLKQDTAESSDRKRQRLDDSTQSVTQTAVGGKRKHEEEDTSADSNGAPVSVESPVSQKRCRMDENNSTNQSCDSDEAPDRVVIVASPVSLKRHRETADSDETCPEKRSRLSVGHSTHLLH